ncbi:MAG: type IV secretory system conjugative DNA transfer family protein [Parahaliea sp.]
MFADLAWWRKTLILMAVALGLAAVIPLASAITTWIFQYEYEHLLIVSMFYHWISPEYAAIALGLALALFLVYAFGAVRLFSPKHSIYGDARLARKHEVQKKGLFDIGGTSIIMGYVGRRLAAFNDDLHVFLAAQTGSGKGVSFVVPNLLNWTDSVICVDIKRDLHKITSGYRHKMLGQPVYVFEPLSRGTDAFNPLSYISDDPDIQIDQLQKIAHSLVVVDDPYFDGQARVLFIGLMQLLIEAHATLGWQCSIGQVLRLLGTEEEIGQFLTVTIKKLDGAGAPLSPACRSNLYAFINEPEKPRGSIRSSLVNHLQLWANPRIDRATSHSTFDLRTFRAQAQTLYLVAAPKDMQRIGPLFRLLFDSFLSANTLPGEQPADQPDKYRYQVLLMLDEFISLGVMEGLVHGLSYVRGWGIKIATVIQSTSQLQSVYDQEGANAFEEGHRARIFFRPSRESKTAATDLADTLGRYTGKSKSVSRPTALSSGGSRSVSVSETDAYLMTPDQIRNMPDHRCFLMVDGVRPVYANKIYYYKDKQFAARVLPALPLPVELAVGDAVYPDAAGAPQPAEVFPRLPDGVMHAVQAIEPPEELTEATVNELAELIARKYEEDAL